MSKEDQHLDENEESTLNEECESEETSEDLENLFEESEEDSQEDKPVTREEIQRLEKGIKKIATQIGREKVEQKDEQKEVKEEQKIDKPQATNPVLKSLYFKANPDAELIWDEVEKEAELLGKDPFQLFESSSYFKGEAKQRAEAKEVEEKSKSKINKPSSDTDFSKNISDVKPEDVAKLTPSQKTKWIKFQAEKERNSDE